MVSYNQRESMKTGRTGGFTFLELMIVIGIITLLASIAVPAYQRMRKRSQALLVKEELRMIDDAIAQYAFEKNKVSGATVTFDSLKPYLKTTSSLYVTGADLFGNVYGPTFIVNTPPSVPPATYVYLLNVLDPIFWSPYGTP